MTLWLPFTCCILLILGSGYYLSFHADALADNLGLSKAWIGIILLASVTSLPELATTIAASHSPDLAIGNIFGSNTINLVIIAIIDLLSKGAPILGVIDIGHILSAGFGLVISGLAMFAILLRSSFKDIASVGNIGLESILIIAIYIIGMKLLYNYEQVDKEKTPPPSTDSKNNTAPDLTKNCLIILVCSIIIIFSGIWLASLGDKIAAATGWGTTFVGSLFLAFATSLPELVVSLSAIKIKSFDMCVGNVFGSNFFNIAIIAILDIISRDTVLLSSVSTNHLLTATLAFIMTSIVIIGIIFRAKRIRIINYEIWMIVILYLGGSYLLFKITQLVPSING